MIKIADGVRLTREQTKNLAEEMLPYLWDTVLLLYKRRRESDSLSRQVKEIPSREDVIRALRIKLSKYKDTQIKGWKNNNMFMGLYYQSPFSVADEIAYSLWMRQLELLKRKFASDNPLRLALTVLEESSPIFGQNGHMKGATLSPSELEDREAKRLLKPSPKIKPPRDDSRRTDMRVDNDKKKQDLAQKDPDMSLRSRDS